MQAKSNVRSTICGQVNRAKTATHQHIKNWSTAPATKQHLPKIRVLLQRRLDEFYLIALDTATTGPVYLRVPFEVELVRLERLFGRCSRHHAGYHDHFKQILPERHAAHRLAEHKHGGVPRCIHSHHGRSHSAQHHAGRRRETGGYLMCADSQKRTPRQAKHFCRIAKPSLVKNMQSSCSCTHQRLSEPHDPADQRLPQAQAT